MKTWGMGHQYCETIEEAAAHGMQAVGHALYCAITAAYDDARIKAEAQARAEGPKVSREFEVDLLRISAAINVPWKAVDDAVWKMSSIDYVIGSGARKGKPSAIIGGLLSGTRTCAEFDAGDTECAHPISHVGRFYTHVPW